MHVLIFHCHDVNVHVEFSGRVWRHIIICRIYMQLIYTFVKKKKKKKKKFVDYALFFNAI